LGNVMTYCKGREPDAATLALITGRGDTYEIVDCGGPSGNIPVGQPTYGGPPVIYPTDERDTPMGRISTFGVPFPDYFEAVDCPPGPGAGGCVAFSAAISLYNQILHDNYEAEKAFRNCRNGGRPDSDCRAQFPQRSNPVPVPPLGLTLPSRTGGGTFYGSIRQYLNPNPGTPILTPTVTPGGSGSVSAAVKAPTSYPAGSPSTQQNTQPGEVVMTTRRTTGAAMSEGGAIEFGGVTLPGLDSKTLLLIGAGLVVLMMVKGK